MFGYMIINSKNEVLLASGNESFKEYVYERLEREVYRPSISDTASISSGVYTDSEPSFSSSSSSSSRHGKLRPPLKSQDSFQDELPAIAHLFLPLISTYRASVEAESAYESISTGRSHVRFHPLERSSILISIASRETDEQSAFVEYLKVQLRLRFGPLLELMNSSLFAVEEGRQEIERVIESYNEGRKFNVNGMIDCRRTATHIAQIPRMNGIVKSICDQLQIFIGSNRCFLMHGREVIFTVNSSHSNLPVWKQLMMEDINAVFDTMMPLPQGAPAQITQCWIRSTQSGLPFFVDIIRTKLTNQLDLFCISESKSNALIRMIMLFIDALDKLGDPEESIEVMIKKLDEYVDIVSRLLVEMVFDRPHPSSSLSSYLRSPVKTATYFRSLWERLRDELTREIGGTPTGLNKRQPFLSGLKSTLSILSISTLGSSLFVNQKRKGIPNSLNALISYMQKQILNLLQEVCADVKRNVSKYKLNLFNNSMHHIYRPRQESLLMKEGIGESWSTSAVSTLFTPSDLRLDMNAYSIRLENTKNDFSYAPEPYTTLINTTYLPPSLGYSCHNVQTEEGENLCVIQWRPPCKPSSKISALFRSSANKSQSPIITAVFSSFVHKQLAMAQVQKLATILEPLISNCARFYN